MSSKLKLTNKCVTLNSVTSVLLTIFVLALVVSLTSPISAQTFSLEKGNLQGAGFLDDEAGIAAYMKSNLPIDLSIAKQAYRTIEEETDQYIIGSVPLTGYPETEDVHAYVHKDGWIVAYYLNKEPTAKIVDWNNYGQDQTIKSTKLEIGIVVVCNFAGLAVKDVKYYHFKYPNANRLMIVADALWEIGEDTFDLKLPSDFVFYERSYSHHRKSNWYSRIDIDDHFISLDPKYTNYGLISPTVLSLDEFHTLKLWSNSSNGAFGAIVLIYQQP